MLRRAPAPCRAPVARVLRARTSVSRGAVRVSSRALSTAQHVQAPTTAPVLTKSVIRVCASTRVVRRFAATAAAGAVATVKVQSPAS